MSTEEPMKETFDKCQRCGHFSCSPVDFTKCGAGEILTRDTWKYCSHYKPLVPRVQRCRDPRHLGLTFRCPNRDPKYRDVICLGCETDPGEGETCGSQVYSLNEDSTYSASCHTVTEEEWSALREIPLEVFNLLRSLARERSKLLTIRKLLNERDFREIP